MEWRSGKEGIQGVDTSGPGARGNERGTE